MRIVSKLRKKNYAIILSLSRFFFCFLLAVNITHDYRSILSTFLVSMRICVQFLVMTKERRIEKRQEEVRENDSRNCMTVSSFFIRVYILKKIYLASIFFFFFFFISLFPSLCLETTSESGVSDLETSMTDFRCTCCPYGYHLDTDFMKFLDDMYGPDVLRTLKKIERKRHDVRRRLINEQQVSDIDFLFFFMTRNLYVNIENFFNTYT